MEYSFKHLTMTCAICGLRHWLPDTYPVGIYSVRDKCENCHPSCNRDTYSTCTSCGCYNVLCDKENDLEGCYCENCIPLLLRAKRVLGSSVQRTDHYYHDDSSNGFPKGTHESYCAHCGNYIRDAVKEGGVCTGCSIEPFNTGMDIKPAKRK
jgi:hypothetical protein